MSRSPRHAAPRRRALPQRSHLVAAAVALTVIGCSSAAVAVESGISAPGAPADLSAPTADVR